MFKVAQRGLIRQLSHQESRQYAFFRNPQRCAMLSLTTSHTDYKRKCVGSLPAVFAVRMNQHRGAAAVGGHRERKMGERNPGERRMLAS